jgi:hypothetical protein
MGAVSSADRVAYYKAALRCLQHVEQRKPTGRRFGPEADARWGSFRGELTTADRIDLLLRDADTEWPGSLGARTVFSLRAVAEDDAFGADWEPLDPVDAEELWRGLPEPPAWIGDALEACARAWGLSLAPTRVGLIDAAEKLVVAGPSAVASLVAAFAEGRDLDWADQVVCVATPPGHRQIASMAGALLNTTRAAVVISSEHGPRSVGQGHKHFISDDADPRDRVLAESLAVEERAWR